MSVDPAATYEALEDLFIGGTRVNVAGDLVSGKRVEKFDWIGQVVEVETPPGGGPPVPPHDVITRNEVAQAVVDAIAGDEQAAADVVAALQPELAASYVSFGPDDPADTLPPGTEYLWNKTDGAGTLLDIVSGVA